MNRLIWNTTVLNKTGIVLDRVGFWEIVGCMWNNPRSFLGGSKNCLLKDMWDLKIQKGGKQGWNRRHGMIHTPWQCDQMLCIIICLRDKEKTDLAGVEKDLCWEQGKSACIWGQVWTLEGVAECFVIWTVQTFPNHSHISPTFCILYNTHKRERKR